MSMSSDIRGLVMTMGLLTRVMTTWLWTQIDWVGTGAAWPAGPGRTLAAGLWPLALSGPCPPSEASQPGPDSGPESSKELWAVRDLGWGARQWPGSVSVYLSRLGEPRSSQASEARTHSQLTEINSDPGPDPHQGPGASHPMVVWPHVCLAVWAPLPVPGVTPVPRKKPNVENETKMIHKGVDKDTTRLSAIIALSFIFTSRAGMWALHRRIKMRRRIHRNEAGGGFKVLHLLKVGYQTSQGEILARHKIRKIWWYDFPSFFYVDIKKIFQRILVTMKMQIWNPRIGICSCHPCTNIKSRPVKYNTNETHKTFSIFWWSKCLGIS